MKRVASFAVACMLAVGCLGVVGCSSGGAASEDQSTQAQEEQAPAELTFDVPFDFDGFSITFGSGYTTTVLENQFSDLNGSTVIAVPMSVVNNSDETKSLNMFYFKAFGPSGTELDDVSSYFMDDDVDWMGELRPGASADTYMHMLYEGDGDYFVSFDNFSEEFEVRLPITIQ